MANRPPDDISQLTGAKDLMKQLVVLLRENIGAELKGGKGWEGAVPNAIAKSRSQLASMEAEEYHGKAGEPSQKTKDLVDAFDNLLANAVGGIKMKADYQQWLLAFDATARIEKNIADLKRTETEYDKLGLNTEELKLKIKQTKVDKQEQEIQQLRYLGLLSKQEAEDRLLALKSIEIQLNRTQAIMGITQQIFQQMTGVAQQFGGYLGLVQQVIQGGNALSGAIAAGRTTFTALNVGTMILGKVVSITTDLVHAADSAYTSFNQATGAVLSYKGQIESSFQAMNKYGISIENMAQSYANLHSEMARFSELSRPMQASLAETGAKLERIGVAAHDSAAAWGTMSTAMGMAAGEAEGAWQGMMEQGLKLGMVPKKLASEFNASKEYLVAYGKAGVGHFMALSQAAKETGVQVGKLVQLHDRMSDLETAAKAAAQFAAMAGRQVFDPLKMIGLAPAEKYREIERALKSLGITEKSTYQDRTLAAQTLGMSREDVMAILNGQPLAADKAAEREDNLNKVIMESAKAVDILKSAFQAISGPFNSILSVVRTLVQGFDWLMNSFGGWTGKIIAWGATIGLLGYSAYRTYVRFSNAAGGATAATTAAAAATGGFASAQSGLAASTAAANTQLAEQNALLVANKTLSGAAAAGSTAQGTAAVVAATNGTQAAQNQVQTMNQVANSANAAGGAMQGAASSAGAATAATGGFLARASGLLASFASKLPMIGLGITAAIGAWQLGKAIWKSFSGSGSSSSTPVEVGYSAATLVATGIERGTPSVAGATYQMAQTMSDRLPHSPAKIGPLSNLDEVGGGMTQTIAKSIIQNTDTVTNATQYMAGSAGRVVQTSLVENMSDKIEQLNTAYSTTTRNVSRFESQSNSSSNSQTVTNNNNTVERGGSGAPNMMQVILKLDGRELGSVITEILNKNTNVASVTLG
jgi:hypothetical protein